MSTHANLDERASGGPVQHVHGDIYYGNITGIVGGRENVNSTDNNSSKRNFKELRQIADWLTALNFHNVQNDTFAKRTAGTGSWFTNSTDFKEWTSKDAAILWVTGMPGVGKTILSSIVIDYLQKSCSADQHVFFVFCRYTDQLSVKDILASLLKQVLESDEPTWILIEPVYQAHKRKEASLSGQKLLDLLQKALSSLHKGYVVLDALDELSDDVKLGLLQSLSELPASLLLTSRPLDLFKGLLSKAVYLKLDIQNEGDISTFIAHQLKESPRLGQLFRNKQQLLEEICIKIVQKSNNMFLIASLQVESLKHCNSVKKLKEAVDVLPTGVSEMYYATLDRINAQNDTDASLAKRALVWLAYEFRPLNVTELQYALAVSIETETFDEEDITPEDMITAVCSGLITIDNKSQIVRLVYYTAHDFIKANISNIFPCNPETFITHSCLVYITASGLTQKTILADIYDFYSFSSFLLKKPLLQYAYNYWGIYANQMSKVEGIPEFLSRFLQQHEKYRYYDTGLQDLDTFEPVHLAAYYGFLGIWPIQPHLYNRRTQSCKQTPLTLAAREGHEAIVALLLSIDGVDINAKIQNGSTALILAAQKGHETIVKLLLSIDGMDINVQDKYGDTALIQAAIHNYESIVALLLSIDGVDVNTKDMNGDSALVLAAEAGHEAIVRLLLSANRIDTNAKGDLNSTVLINAAKKGHEGVVKLLLSIDGLDINAMDNLGMTALIYAASKGHEGIVKLLLSMDDIDITPKGRFGNTPLIKAVEKGYEGIVKLLLSIDKMDINIKKTALREAVYHGHESIAKLLLSIDNIADAKDGSTILMQTAANRGHKTIMELLLSIDGIDINAKNKYGDTALILAAYPGHEAAVKLLLSIDGININAKNKNGVTALIAAGRSGHEAVGKLLLSALGSDINDKNDDKTVLFYASRLMWFGIPVA